MKTTLFIVMTLLLMSCRNEKSSNSDEKSYEEKVMSVEEVEQENPLDFLYLEDATYRKNLLGEWVLEGKIVSTATVAVYKDVELYCEFYTKTETFQGSKNVTIYEFIEPGEKVRYKEKLFAPPSEGKTKIVNYWLNGASVKY